MPSALFFKARQFTLRWRSGSRPENQRRLPGVSAQMFENLPDDHRTSILAMTFTLPPQRRQVSMSILNMRFRR